MSNYLAELKTLNMALNDFETQIRLLEADLSNYKQHPKATEKGIYFKQNQIKIFTSILNSLHTFKDTTNLIFSENEAHIKKLDELNFKLYGVCILHGISNIHIYTRMEAKNIIHLVKEAINDGWRQIPFEIQHGEAKDKVIYSNVPTVNFNDLKTASKK